MDVLCIGHSAYDLTLPLDSFPKENEKYSISKSMEIGGGPAANGAYLLSKWGVETGFIGLIGDDLYGKRIVEEFKEVGTDLSLIEIQKNCSTPFSTILINKENGSRTIINRSLPHKGIDINRDNLNSINPKVILVDGHELEVSLYILDKIPNALSVLDAGSLKRGTKVLAKKVDYLVSSEKFAKQYSEMNSLNNMNHYKKCINKLKDLAKGQVVVTLGERGLIYDNQGKVTEMEAYDVIAIDTTAAGDIFHGAFAYGLLKGFQMEKNLRFSSATSSLSVEKLGGRQSIPEIEDVIRKMK